MTEVAVFFLMSVIVLPIALNWFSVSYQFWHIGLIALVASVTQHILPIGLGVISFAASIFTAFVITQHKDVRDLFYAIAISRLSMVPVLMLVQ
ncbi:Uncharacterised protein [BD1-7 clade bacterium]|uniref:Uncharacterized protein n=1 Tax=BD1-7 clade bacterium TaxID=2029982 RepID=A0A5S9R1I6_9GAMM|nr:Uncharacterised protein [BD1-7 clade bacterium]